ncbi:hypothetical protein EXIGLDRAFT_687036 [Exidia glandulosa HHB12029]|uniref:Copper homeostasis protein cutC homolog n=1 Tax=Exidia glandulosa HHB12029 TaxID=1314781 RepID=A0A165BHT7_EXIGL|nr:hypothetical protein EXIGLDRAFT_687036 [Exidia glandulosa HHB12029]
MTAVTIEVCIDSLESARAALSGGANRLEVCGNLGAGGGTTPSLGLVRTLRQRFPTTPLMVMIRPRIGDFVYTEDEIDIMLADILAFKEEGVLGVVLGVLTPDRLVDTERTNRLISAAQGTEVTFHRAVDMTANAEQAFSSIARIEGITRVLTSGLRPTVLEGIDTLATIARRQDLGALRIIPGSGVNADTVEPILRALWTHGVREVHMSGGEWIESSVSSGARPEDMDMGGWKIWRTSERKVRAVREIVDSISREMTL